MRLLLLVLVLLLLGPQAVIVDDVWIAGPFADGLAAGIASRACGIRPEVLILASYIIPLTMGVLFDG